MPARRHVPLWIAAWAMLVLAGCGSRQAEQPGEPEASTPEARAYVGDEACASCHEGLYRSYHRTGMGRSVTRFDPATAPEHFDTAQVYDPQRDLTYEAFVRGDTLYQREFRHDEAGDVVYERTHAVEWVVGSGNATRSYMMEVNGIVTEMPLTWYVERARWDLSPAYQQTNYRFSRPIVLECMTCHNGLPEHTPFTQAHYTEVPLGITCERCHGPGSEHVDTRLAGFAPDSGKADPTVVSSQHLDRDRQLAVCQQCHLTGITVFKPGEDATTYRPGTPLAAHRTVFAVKEERDDPERFGIASHAERLALSACYRHSGMTCTTCHDPHAPVADLGADTFNDVCRSCHDAGAPDASPVCGRDDAHDAAEAMTGDCVRCHMQTSGTSDIPHVLFTDHWIRRTVPSSRPPEDVDRILVRPEPFELVRMTEPLATADEPDALLEEAAAYFTFYETRHRLPDYLGRVTRLVRAGLAAGADHPEARLALGRALIEQDSLVAAVQALEAATQAFPDHVDLAVWLGEAYLRNGDTEEALVPLERAVAMQPKDVEAWLKLARAYGDAGQAADAEAAFRTALDLDPVHHPQAWNNLGYLVLQQRRVDEAGPLFERALALDPDLPVALVNLGSVRMIEQDYEAAADLFEQALDLDPNNVSALGNLGLIYAQRGQWAAARDMLRRVLRLTPGDRRAQAALAQVEQRLQASK